MIGFLRGILHHRDPDGRLVIDVQGVGYVVSTGLAAFARHDDGDRLECYVHTNVKEDEIALYGFETATELQAFRQLLAVSGIGPKVALQILTGLSPEALLHAIEGSDAAAIARAKGVGKRLAEKIIVELKGKFDLGPAAIAMAPARPVAPVAHEAFDDLRSALGHLQYRPKEIDAVVAQLKTERDAAPAGTPEPNFDALLRRALSLLRK
jgi:Holliday junction DNA helicase RuvA